MNQGCRTLFFAIAATGILISCKKSKSPDPGPGGGGGGNTDTIVTLKQAANFPIGMAIGYNLIKNNTTYRNTIVREADQVTFDYNMKHGAIVRDDGTFDFSRADEMVTIAQGAGLEVFGHALVWHQNQNGNYLRSLTTASTGGPNLLPGGDFEAGTGNTGTGSLIFTGWNVLVGGTSAGTFSAVAGNGTPRALEATVTTPGTNAYDMQAIGSGWTATVGTQYKVSVDIKSSVSNGRVRLVNQNAQYQQLDITPTTSWATYTWTLTAVETSPILRLNFPNAGVYTIDNITITDLTAGPPPGAADIAKAVDTAMSRFIRNSMMRYAGKVKMWDVVNEPMTDGTGRVRENSGTTTGDIFYWQQYLGRNYALKAFQYAKAADPSAILYINEYNLEIDNTKLDSLIAYVAELRGKGAHIDGIGTQMHISLGLSQANIDNMFKKLAATGLKVRISELDVRVNLSNAAGFVPTQANLNEQATLYYNVVQSYLKNVPSAQQGGITMWGVADTDSWYVTTMGRAEFPLLFDAGFQKKPAFTSMLQALKLK